MVLRSAVAVLPDSARAEQAQKLAEQGAEVQVRDYVVRGHGARTLPCLHLWSRSPTPWWERFDPYWNTRVFNAQRGWLSANKLDTHVYGATHLPGDPRAVHDNVYSHDMDSLLSAAATLTGDPHRRFVSILRGCGRALPGQLAALAGIKSERSERAARQALRPLHEAQILERAWHHSPGIAYPRAQAWQIKDGKVYNTWAQHIVEQGELANVYGCMRPVLSARADKHRSRHTRHQVLSVELALRAMETSDIWAGWMPETACRPEWFLPPDHPLKNRDWKIVADGCLIRFDGARIFLEIEASVSSENRLKDKIRAWSAILGQGNTGAAVLFVAACFPAQIPVGIKTIRKAVQDYATPDTRDRILVGSWHDYSPDFGLVTPDVASLRSGRLNRREGWEQIYAGEVDVGKTDSTIVQRIWACTFVPTWSQNKIHFQ